ncbi:hypothetical protein QR680_008093 [Steinernema hermaphroditum]|uniref:Protein-tyrosine-phosphatase n=1 Tax=Steinernema hermaphroditum TaxID=289476 RepID=A0AA39IGT4_9BILA|nr:hypothetical protein QR680_008093 [Steinernema hermaphroditum]
MAISALAAFKKFRRQNSESNEEGSKSTRSVKAASKKKDKKRPSEKGEGTVAPMAPTSTLTKMNDEGSTKRKKKGRKKKKSTEEGGNANAGTIALPSGSTNCLSTTTSPVAVPGAELMAAVGSDVCWDPATIVAELLQTGRINVSGNEKVQNVMREFAKKAAQLTANAVHQEYMTALKKYVPENTTRVAFDANTDKNRYQDVICADRDRVLLIDRPGLTDYIHANRVVGKPLPQNRTFICTQGPTLATITEFWRMVRQEQVDSIVMLCETKECGKDKCAQYWPLNTGETMSVPVVDFVLTNKGMHTHEGSPGLISTVLSLKDVTGFEQRIIHHQWKNWPDRGVPEQTDVTLKILQLVRPQLHQKQCTVVHCSAGIGRTGSVVAVELCAQRLLSGKSADILSLVKHLRSKRMHSIQTDQQYLFVYKCLLALIREHVSDPETHQAIDTYNSSYDAIVKGGAAPTPVPPAVAIPNATPTPPDPFANAPSPFAPVDYASVPPLQPASTLPLQPMTAVPQTPVTALPQPPMTALPQQPNADPNQATNSVFINNFFSY